MKNIQFKVIIIGLISIAILATLFWLFSKIPMGLVEPINLQNNKEQEIGVLKQIFKKGVIIPQEEIGQYIVESDDKVEYSAVDDSPIRKKSVSIKLLDVDLNKDGKDETVALTTLIFMGDVCTACRDRFYINVFEVDNSTYIMKSETEFRGLDDGLFNSDIALEKIQLIDINNDGTKEIQIIFKADSYFGLNKTKVAILQQQGDKFKIVWQQIIHNNMDNYGALSEEDKQNYDAVFTFKKAEGEYSDIIVEKTISKDKGIELSLPKKETLIYKWDAQKQEYYLLREEKIGEEKPGKNWTLNHFNLKLI